MSEAELAGVKELTSKLNELGAKLGAKALRKAALLSMTPVVRAARLRAPVGTEAHRTYKGNLVAPGFAKRSVRKDAKIVDGKAVARVGVKPEAFYALIPETGPHRVTTRRKAGQSGEHPIRPYTIPRHSWLTDAFESQQQAVKMKLAAELKKQIAKVAR